LLRILQLCDFLRKQNVILLKIKQIKLRDSSGTSFAFSLCIMRDHTAGSSAEKARIDAAEARSGLRAGRRKQTMRRFT
jgi:hypothetical protein